MYESDSHKEWCELCDDGGELLMCEDCPKVYCLPCLALDAVPIGEWRCPQCSPTAPAKTPAAQKKQKPQAKAHVKQERRISVVNEEPESVASKPKRGRQSDSMAQGMVCTLTFAEQMALALSASSRDAMPTQRQRRHPKEAQGGGGGAGGGRPRTAVHEKRL